jgi:hypothetical protein
VFSALTTRADGNARWIRSPRLSVVSVNNAGPPPEKSSGLAASTSSLPPRFASPAAASASSDAPPDVQLNTTSPCAAASANVTLPSPAVREPTCTS